MCSLKVSLLLFFSLQCFFFFFFFYFFFFFFFFNVFFYLLQGQGSSNTTQTPKSRHKFNGTAKVYSKDGGVIREFELQLEADCFGSVFRAIGPKGTGITSNHRAKLIELWSHIQSLREDARLLQFNLPDDDNADAYNALGSQANRFLKDLVSVID